MQVKDSAQAIESKRRYVTKLILRMMNQTNLVTYLHLLSIACVDWADQRLTSYLCLSLPEPLTDHKKRCSQPFSWGRSVLIKKVLRGSLFFIWNLKRESKQPFIMPFELSSRYNIVTSTWVSVTKNESVQNSIRFRMRPVAFGKLVLKLYGRFYKSVLFFETRWLNQCILRYRLQAV